MPQSPAGVVTQSRKAGGGIRGIYCTGIHFQPFRKFLLQKIMNSTQVTTRIRRMMGGT